MSGDSFKYTQDIFLRKRLFLPLSASLNDPTEGAFTIEPPDRPLKTASVDEHRSWANQAWGMASVVAAQRNKARILSLTTNEANPLMWSHYADSHRGICIGFSTEACQDLKKVFPVKYSDKIVNIGGKHSDGLFSKKHTAWSYEQEWRLATDKQEYVDLPDNSIVSVIFGGRVDSRDADWVKDWINLAGWRCNTHRATFSQTGYDMKIR